MISVTSAQNALFKEVRSLKARKAREERKQYFIEGVRFVEEAVKEKQKLSCVFFSETFLSRKGEAQGTLLSGINSVCSREYVIPDRLFRELSDTENPQGVLAVLDMKQYDLKSLIEKGKSCFILLDGVQDPGNMGAIIRTADAAGFTGAIISAGSVDVYNPKVLRSTMGSIFRLPVVTGADLISYARLLRSEGIRLYAAHLEGTLNYFDADMKTGTAIIVGSEANGVSPGAAAACDALVRLPMPGRTESLNASVAAGILIYEVVRQRMLS